MWVVIQPDAGIEEHEGKPSLKDLQGAVGGFIEHVQLRHYDLWIDEEGKLNGKATNATATRLALRDEAIWPDDRIVGPAVLTARSAPGTRGLTAEQVQELRADIAKIGSWPPVGTVHLGDLVLG